MKTRQLSSQKELVKHMLIWSVLCFSFLPLAVMLLISFKDNQQFVQAPFMPTLPMHFGNWLRAARVVLPYIGNSLFVCMLGVFFALTAATAAAYVFARFKFPGKTVLWYALLALLFMPAVMNLVPLFIIMRDLNLLNSLLGLSILYATGGQVFCIFVLRNFIEEIPTDLFEAAEIDGASFVSQIRYVVLPMCGSILGTLAIMQFIGYWNNFIHPLVFINEQTKQLLPVKLMELNGQYVKEWGPMMASYTLAAIPLVIIFMFTMRLFVKGLTGGAVKG